MLFDQLVFLYLCSVFVYERALCSGEMRLEVSLLLLLFIIIIISSNVDYAVDDYYHGSINMHILNLYFIKLSSLLILCYMFYIFLICIIYINSVHNCPQLIPLCNIVISLLDVIFESTLLNCANPCQNWTFQPFTWVAEKKERNGKNKKSDTR